jgi:CxxC-x17-CxxC domain-containing protein
MSFQNKTLKCVDCGTDFDFTVAEQEFHQSKGFTNEPKRCPACRTVKRQSVSGSSGSGNGNYGSSAPRQMYPAVCATCGKDTQVPFQPSGDRPVYCSDCYRKTNPVKRY